MGDYSRPCHLYGKYSPCLVSQDNLANKSRVVTNNMAKDNYMYYIRQKKKYCKST